MFDRIRQKGRRSERLPIMDSHDARFILIGLTRTEADAVQTALLVFAVQQDEEGDVAGYAQTCDDVRDRVDAMLKLVDVDAHEAMKTLSMGIYRGRPQG